MNQTDPLSELKPIHLPDAIGWWPPAIGWWIVTLGIMLIVTVALWWLYKRHKSLAYKREAMLEFHTIQGAFQSHGDKSRLLADLSTLLKRACISRYGREQTAGLAGEAWLKFLDQSGSTNEFSQGCGRALLAQRYVKDPSFTPQELIELVKKWLEKHS